MDGWARTAWGTVGVAASGVAYAALVERRWFVLRRAVLPVLAAGSRPLRVLHLSDLHMTPGQRDKQRWVAGLAALEPDLVVDTGDNLASAHAVPAVLTALDPLLDRPGLVVWGSNDYYGPRPRNPATYLLGPSHQGTDDDRERLPWRELRAAMLARGWVDATHTRVRLELAGTEVVAAGVDDPHLDRDDLAAIAGPVPGSPALRLGLTHAPEPRVLDRFAADDYDLVLAGHTHGGQLRVPGYGALVTNCGIDRARVSGASRWGEHTHLHVSAGLGTSPYAPVRFACRPEATLLTLIPRPA